MSKPEKTRKPKPAFPKTVGDGKGGIINVEGQTDSTRKLYGVQTSEASNGILISALTALGVSREEYRSMMLAVTYELAPKDPVEAMLVSQMAATHLAISHVSRKMFDANISKLGESYERSVTRLSRTFLAQMDALKKYRAEAQQIVRVERVNVESGGQAIVRNVSSQGGRWFTKWTVTS